MSSRNFRKHSNIAVTKVIKYFDTWNNAISQAGVNKADIKTTIAKEVIKEIQRVYFEYFENDYMSHTNFRKHSTISVAKVLTYFNTWKNALTVAGVNYVDLKTICANEIITEIRRVYFKHFQNNHMTQKEFGQYSSVSVAKVLRYFDTWDNALTQAEVIHANNLSIIRANEVIAEIKRVYYKYFAESQMSIGMFRQHSSISIDSVYKYFNNWDTALKEANVFFNPQMLTPDEKRKHIISDLHRIKEINKGLFFNFNAYQEYKGRYTMHEILRLFGSLQWRDLIKEELGISRKYQSKSNIVDYSEKELFDEMKIIWKKLGVRPSSIQFVLNTTIHQNFYLKKYKTWTLFVEHFLSKNEVYNSYQCKHRHSFEVTKDKLIADLKRVKKAHPKQVLSFVEYQKLGGRYKVLHFANNFGNWTKALQLVGLTSQKSALPENQLLLEELQKIILQLGRNPSPQEVDSMGKYPYKYYRRRFSSIKKACLLSL